MENSKDRSKGTKPAAKAAGPDLRQLDLWGRPINAPPPEGASKNSPQATASSTNSPVTSKPPEVRATPSVPRPGTGSSPRPPGSQVRAPITSNANQGMATSAPRSRSAVPSGVLPPPRSLPALTRRQHELLDYLAEREQNGMRAPSLTEICRDLGLVSRGSLHKQISALVEARLVEPMNGKQRGVRLQRSANDETRLPLLGAIAAGQPIEALTRDESVVVPGWLRTGGDCYALRIRGDSMRDVGILDGDIVVIESRKTARNGELVVALIDNQETTLKRIEQKPGEVLLHPENPAYSAQRYVPERVSIQGVVVGSIRRY